MGDFEYGLGIDANDLFGESLANAELQSGLPKEETVEGKQDNEITTEIVDPEVELFASEEKSESGGSKEETVKENDDTPPNEGQSSPNFYSSITEALFSDGVLSSLTEEEVNSIKSADAFRDLLEKEVSSRLDSRYRAIDEALHYGIEVPQVQRLVNAIDYLNNIDEESLSSEEAEAAELRKYIIAEDLANRGYSQERIQKELKKSFDSGTDIEDAKESLYSVKEAYANYYQNTLEQAKLMQEHRLREEEEQRQYFKESILKEDDWTKQFNIDEGIRKRAYDNISSPKYYDEQTGNYITELQKAQLENPVNFMKGLSIVFTLTDGFTNLDGLIKGPVNTKVKSKIKDLENTLRGVNQFPDNDLSFVSKDNDDDDLIKRGFKLDI